MGWSCTKKAGDVLDAITQGCINQTGSSNVFVADGKRFFFETSRREHNDGGITGGIMRFTGETTCRKAGMFRINGDGTIARMPKAMKDLLPERMRNYKGVTENKGWYHQGRG